MTSPSPSPPLASRRRDAVGGLALAAAVGLSFAILSGFFGDRLHLFDTFAHFRAHAALALVVAAGVLVWARLWAAGLASLGPAAIGLVTVYPYMLAPTPAAVVPADAPRYTLLQMNLRHDSPDRPATLRLIGALEPDVVTVEEMTEDWQTDFSTLSSRYPYQYYCAPPQFEGDVGILSRRPFADGDKGVCDVDSAFAAKRIDFNGVQVVIGAQHLRWPWPGRQWRQVDELLPRLALLGDPLLIAGDFNAAPWSAAVQTFAAASGTRVTAGIGSTWFFKYLPASLARSIGLPLDNVLASDGVEILAVERTAATGSDHLPVLVTFSPRFARPNEPTVQTVAR